MRAGDKVSGLKPKLDEPKYNPKRGPGGQEGWDAGKSCQTTGLWPVLESEGPQAQLRKAGAAAQIIKNQGRTKNAGEKCQTEVRCHLSWEPILNFNLMKQDKQIVCFFLVSNILIIWCSRRT